MSKERGKVVKVCKTEIKGTVKKLYLQLLKEQEMPESEYLRDLIRKDLKERFKLTEGFNRLQP